MATTLSTPRDEIDSIVASVRAAFERGTTQNVAWRKRQLRQLMKMIEENHEQIADAVAKDFKGMKLRTLAELGVHAGAKFALDNLDKWVKDKVVPHSEMFGSSFVRPTAKGVALIIGPFNYPWFCCLLPAVGAIAAGNAIVFKPSEMAVNSAIAMQALVSKYLDKDAIRFVQGGIQETTRLLELKFDHIFYTGSTSVGKIVMKAAAENLTPVTLELGGKSPVIVDETAQLKTAVDRILLSKYLNVAQTCVAADYVLVHHSRKEELVKMLKEALRKSLGEDAQQCLDFGRIINERHVQRLESLIKGSNKEKIIAPAAGREGKLADAGDNYVTAALIDEPDMEDPIMKEEIFGPLLPIKSYSSLPEAVQMIKKVCPEPLALYIFSEKQSNIDYVLKHTQSGGVCVNSTLEHLSNQNLPFGGFGTSGMGNYFGEYGFRTFTHERAVFVKDTRFNKKALMPPPPVPEWLYNIAIKASITGFIPPELKPLKKPAAIAFLVALFMVVRKYSRL